MSNYTNNSVSEKEKKEFFEEFNNGLHRIGRFTLIAAMIMLISIPFIVGAVNGVMPSMPGLGLFPNSPWIHSFLIGYSVSWFW